MWTDLETADQIEVDSVVERSTTERLSCFAHTLQLTVGDGMRKLTNATSLLAKCSKLSNLTHQSTQFREAFERSFGSGRAIPKMNATRWNSMFDQISCINELDCMQLSDLLKATDHLNLLFTQRETAVLRELVDILRPFSEATDLLQGQTYTTIGCVVPSVVGLHKCLNMQATSVKYHGSLVDALMTSLSQRFNGLLQNVFLCPTTPGPVIPSSRNNGAGFGSQLYLMASALDPNYALLWLEEDHPGTAEVKKTIRDNVMSKCICNSSCQ